MKYLPKPSKMPLDNSLSSSLQSWLGKELDARGIDSIIYTRYILSILQQDDFEADLGERELFPRGKKVSPGQPSKSPQPLNNNNSAATLKTISKGISRTKKKGCGVDKTTEEWKKCAAVECLLSVSDEDSGIEGLVDELCVKLKQQSSHVKDKSLNMADAESSDSVISTSPDDAAEKYYAAFPALSDKLKNDTSTQWMLHVSEVTWSTVAQKSASEPLDDQTQRKKDSGDLTDTNSENFQGRYQKDQGKNSRKSPYCGNRKSQRKDFGWNRADYLYYYDRDIINLRGNSQERCLEKSPKFERQSSCPDFNVFSQHHPQPTFIVPKFQTYDQHGIMLHQNYCNFNETCEQKVSPGKISLQDIFGTSEVSEIEPCKTLVVDGQLVRLCATSMNSNNLNRLTNVCLKEAPMEKLIINNLWQEETETKENNKKEQHLLEEQEINEKETKDCDSVSEIINSTDDDVFVDNQENVGEDTDVEDPSWYTGPMDIITPNVSPGSRDRLYKRNNLDEESSQPQSSCTTPTFNLLWEEVWDDSGVFIGAKLKEPPGTTAGETEETMLGETIMDLDAIRNVELLTGSSGSESESDYIDMSGSLGPQGVEKAMAPGADRNLLSAQRYKSPDRLQIFKELASEESVDTAAHDCSSDCSISDTVKVDCFGTVVQQEPKFSQYKGSVIPEITQNKVPDDRPVFFLDEPELNNNHPYHPHHHPPSAKVYDEKCVVTSSCSVNNLLCTSLFPSLHHTTLNSDHPSGPNYHSSSVSSSSSVASSPIYASTSIWSTSSLCNLFSADNQLLYEKSPVSKALFARGPQKDVNMDTVEWPWNHLSSFVQELQMPMLSLTSLSPFTCSNYLLLSNSIWQEPPLVPPPKIWDINMASRKIRESPFDGMSSPFSSDINDLLLNFEYDHIHKWDIKSKDEGNFIEGGLYGGTLSSLEDAWSMTRSDCSEDEDICEQKDNFQMDCAFDIYKTGSLDHLDKWFGFNYDDADYSEPYVWTNNLTGSMDLLPSETSAFSSEGIPPRVNQIPHVQSEPSMSPRQPFSKWGKNKYRMVQVKHLYKPDTSILRHLGLTAEGDEQGQDDIIDKSKRKETPEHHFKPIMSAAQQSKIADAENKQQDYVLLDGVVYANKEDNTDMVAGSNTCPEDQTDEQHASSCKSSITRSASGTLYQLYQGKETINVSFVPRFRLCREHKYIQTGDSPHSAQNEIETATQELTERFLIEILKTDVDDVETYEESEHVGVFFETNIGEKEQWEIFPASFPQKDKPHGGYNNNISPSPPDLAKFWEHSAVDQNQDLISEAVGVDPTSIWCFKTDEEPEVVHVQPANSSWETVLADPEMQSNDLDAVHPLTSSPDLEHTFTQAYLDKLMKQTSSEDSHKSSDVDSEAFLNEINDYCKQLLKELGALKLNSPMTSDSGTELENEEGNEASSPVESRPIPIPKVRDADNLHRRREKKNVRNDSLDLGQDLMDSDDSMSGGEKMMFMMDTSDRVQLPDGKAHYSTDLEEQWLNSVNFSQNSISISPKNKTGGSLKLCSFYLQGNCYKMECKYSHDMSLTTCQHWKDGECFKGITCPFLHGNHGHAKY